MIYHLKVNYYKIIPADLKLNTPRLDVPNNKNEPFKTIIDQIETAVDFADAGKVPYIPEQVVTTACDLIFVTGYFTNTCRQWNQNPVVEKTCAEFNSYFAK